MKSALLKILLGCSLALGSSTSMALPNNGELKIGISQEFENLNPLIMSMVATTYIHYFAMRSLVNLNAEGKWYPQMAKSIPTIENGQAKFVTVNGKKTIEAVWEILDKAQWGDGTPLTCADFEFGWTVAKSPLVSVGEKEIYTQVEKIAWDPKTPKICTFTYEKAKWDFNHLPQFYPLPKHIEEPIFKKYGKEKEGYEHNSAYVKNPTNPGLYYGPYLISEVKLGSHVTLTPNPKYYGDQPNIKKVIIKLIPNTGTLEANLRSQTIDKISSLGLTLDQALAFEKKVAAEKLPYVVAFQPSNTYEHIDLNLDNPILKDVKVRKALVYGLNREDLVKALFEGKQIVAFHALAPMDPWYTADPSKIVVYRYSKREANKLLDEAGWKMGADGVRTKGGQRLSLSFMTTAGNKTRELVQVFLKDQWKQIGVEVIIRNEPGRVFFGETTRKRQFPAMAMYAWMSNPENTPRAQFGSKSVPTKENGFSGQNYPNWKNAKVDELIDKLDLEFDSAKRTAIAQEIMKYYTDEVPVIPLYYRSDVAVIPANMTGFRMPGHQFSETNMAETWSLGTKIQ